MATLARVVPEQSRYSLTRRGARQDRLLNTAKRTEPALIYLGLRRQRTQIANLMTDLVTRAKTEEPDPNAVAKLSAAYVRVAEMILRICRVPLAPPGSAKPGDDRPQLDITPEFTAPGPVETAE